MRNYWQQTVFCYDAPWYRDDLALLGRLGSPLITFPQHPGLHAAMLESFCCGGTENLRLDFGGAFGKLRAFIVTPLPEVLEALEREVNLASFTDVFQALDVAGLVDPEVLCEKFLAEQEALKAKPKAARKK